MGMDGDHRDRLFRRHRTDDRENLGAREAKRPMRSVFNLDEIAVLRIVRVIRIDHQLFAAPLDGQHTPAAAGRHLEDAHAGILALVENLDDPRGIGRAAAIAGGKILASTRSPNPATGALSRPDRPAFEDWRMATAARRPSRPAIRPDARSARHPCRAR